MCAVRHSCDGGSPEAWACFGGSLLKIVREIENFKLLASTPAVPFQNRYPAQGHCLKQLKLEGFKCLGTFFFLVVVIEAIKIFIRD